ncbi:hypothetical protein D9613_002397 [Agrocybe pediades]|uniref:Uncharacterized protein n=1 Tax=Agrocybe pediades TaxID=84607 RepID=A0A8H4R7W4_9AGAR|nr:hypothetical protein D9613_002397 [Agrocybe pediades]
MHLKITVLSALAAAAAARVATPSAAPNPNSLLHARAEQAIQGLPAPPNCYWDGTAPFCAGACPNGYTEEIRDPYGNGACCWTGLKVLCCRDAEGCGSGGAGRGGGSSSSSSSATRTAPGTTGTGGTTSATLTGGSIPPPTGIRPTVTAPPSAATSGAGADTGAAAGVSPSASGSTTVTSATGSAVGGILPGA